MHVTCRLTLVLPRVTDYHRNEYPDGLARLIANLCSSFRWVAGEGEHLDPPPEALRM